MFWKSAVPKLYSVTTYEGNKEIDTREIFRFGSHTNIKMGTSINIKLFRKIILDIYKNDQQCHIPRMGTQNLKFNGPNSLEINPDR